MARLVKPAKLIIIIGMMWASRMEAFLFDMTGFSAEERKLERAIQTMENIAQEMSWTALNIMSLNNRKK